MRFSNSIVQTISIVVLVILLSLAPETYAQNGSSFSVVEEVRIGQLHGADEYMFGDIAGFAVSDEGKILVADRAFKEIRLYDSDGTFISYLGREGRGPGEFLRFGGIKPLSDGRFALWDQANARVTVYASTGDLEKTIPILGSQLYIAKAFQTDVSDNLYVRTIFRISGQYENPIIGWRKFSPEGVLLDSIVIYQEPMTNIDNFMLVTPSGYARPFSIEFSSELSSLGYLVFGTNDSYTINLGYNEQVAKPITRNYSPIEVTSDEWDQWEKTRTRFGTGTPVPKKKPPFKDIYTDSQGRIWVSRYVEAEYTDQASRSGSSGYWEKPTFDVFYPSGAFFGTVTLPWKTFLVDARDDKIWVTAMGDEAEEYIVRYKMIPSSSADTSGSE